MAGAGRVAPGRSDFVADHRKAVTIRHGPCRDGALDPRRHRGKYRSRRKRQAPSTPY